ncbi:hypothetical protein GCM10012319_04030 [Comamonas sp. KCTC 72670]|nr:hypothetical protein GCM10012319_04030 [Comamonas sp. KCTC 72670]
MEDVAAGSAEPEALFVSATAEAGGAVTAGADAFVSELGTAAVALCCAVEASGVEPGCFASAAGDASAVAPCFAVGVDAGCLASAAGGAAAVAPCCAVEAS